MVKKLPPCASRFILWRQTQAQLRQPEESLAARAAMLSKADQELLARPEIKAQVLAYRQEAVRQGVRGTVREMQILASAWGFRLEDIAGEVHIWHWEEDLFVPIQMGRYLAERIPNAQTHFLPGGGHYSLFEHWPEILDCLVEN
jgi:pimeloyl-ACP methyl ester carboxylesterase